MGKTIGFPANTARLNRASRAVARKRSEKQHVAEVHAAPLVEEFEQELEQEINQEYFGLTTPTTKYDYDVYMESETLRAGVYPYNREYRFVERKIPDGRIETIYSGPNFLDSRTVIQDEDGQVICTIRANHMGNGVIEVRYLEDGACITEHQAPEECDNFSYVKDSRNRITSLTLSDGTHLQFAYGADNPAAFLFVDKGGVEWRRCPKTLMFKNAQGNLLGGVPVQLVAANESGSYMLSSYGRFTVFHRNGETEERYFPTIRDLLDQDLPVTVAVRSDADLLRAESFMSAMHKQYAGADLSVAVLPRDARDGDLVEGRYVSRFY